MGIHIETERLIIRDIEESDVNDFFELDSDSEVHRYLGNKPVKSIEQSKDMIKLVRAQYKEYGIGRWAIIDRNTNDFIGWTGLKYEQQIRKDFNYYDLGFRLKKKYWGNGIATEAALESLKFGFCKLNLNNIFAAAHIENVASNRILKKIGLQFIDTFEFDDAFHNWYIIKKSDWIDLTEPLTKKNIIKTSAYS